MPTGAANGHTPTILAIDHVQLAMPAGGENEARHFYGGILGLEEVAKPEILAARGGCWFTSSDRKLHVHLGVEAAFRPATKAHPVFLVADIDRLRQRLTDSGAQVLDDTTIPGSTAATRPTRSATASSSSRRPVEVSPSPRAVPARPMRHE